MATVVIDGQTAQPWLFRPDGIVTERLEWLTDVMQSYNGGEQRVQLRAYPRRFFDFASTVSGWEKRLAENLLHAWQAKPFAVPVWMDAQFTTAGSSQAFAFINGVETAGRDFVVGGFVFIGRTDTYEIKQINVIEANRLILTSNLTLSWPAGTEVIPIRLARLPDDQRLARFTGDTSYGRLRFECMDNSDWPALTGETAYRSFPVLGQAPNWTEDVEQAYLAKLSVIDPRVGRRFYEQEAGASIRLQSHRWLLDGRTAIDNFRRMLYARRGRVAAFWLPTFALDFRAVADITSAATTIDVERFGYTDLGGPAIGRRDIRIELLDGSVFFRRITASANVSFTVERLSISSSLGVAVTAAQIRSISYLDLVRFEGDSAEIAWWRSDVAEASLMTRGSRNDL